MSDPTPKPKSRRRLLRVALVVVSLALVLALLGLWYLSSPAFAERVRQALVREIENVTGGRVELASFTWNLSRLEFEARDLVVHGLEPPGETPYARVERVFVRARIDSWFGRRVSLRALHIERPALHLLVAPDGSSNQPTPKVARESGRSPIEHLFDLSIDRLEMTDGVLLWNQRPIPLELRASNVAAQMKYRAAERRYDGRVDLGKVDSVWQSWRPWASTLQAEFSLLPQHAELRSLRWASGRSQVEAQGGLLSYEQLRLELDYRASLDLAEAGAVARMPELRAGVLQMEGHGTVTGAEFASTGQAAVRELQWRAATLHVPSAEAAAQYTLTHDFLTLSGISGSVFGGRLRGEAEVHQWSDAEHQQGTASLALQGWSLASLADAVSTRSLPLNRLRPVGSSSGTVEMAWQGAPAGADAAIVMDVAPPAAPGAGTLPVTATLRSIYRGRRGVMEVSELELATPRSRLEAGGILGRQRANLDLVVETAHVGEFQPLIAALRRSGGLAEDLPLDLQGRASFRGKLAGPLAAPVVTGQVEVTDFDFVQSLAAAPGAPPSQVRLHWDRFAGEVRYAPEQLMLRSAVLRRGSAHINLEGAVELRAGSFEPASPFHLRATMRNADLSDLQALAGVNHPATGVLDLTLQARGTLEAPHGEGTLQLTDAMVYGERIASLRSDVRLQGREVELRDLRLRRNGGTATGTVAYHLGSGQMRAAIEGADFDLAQFPTLQSERLALAGRGHFKLQGSGTLAEPSLQGTLRLRGLVVNGEQVGAVDADAVTEGADLRLTVRTYFHSAELTAEGTVRMRDDWPADLRARFAEFDVDPLLRAYLRGRITGHSSLAGTVELRGPLRRPRDLALRADLHQVQVEVENVPLQSDGPLRVTMQNQVVRVEQFRLLGDGTDFTAAGSVELAGRRRVDLRLLGRVNMRLAQSFDPDIVAYGLTTVDLRVAGTLPEPSMRGQLQIADAGISYVDLPTGLAGINGVMIFDENRLQVQTLTARTGGGTLDLGGFITWSRGLRFNLSAKGEGVRVRHPSGVSAVADLEMRLVGSAQDALLSGDVLVTRFGLSPQFDFALYVARSRMPQTPVDPASPLNNLRLAVHVVSTPELQVQTGLAKLSGDADLRLRGTATRPVLLGRVNIIDGEMIFAGTRYRLERGDVSFVNPTGIHPVLNLNATARVRDYDVSLEFHGPVDNLRASYRSDPPLPEADVIALLALGRTREEGVMQSTQVHTFAETASSALLGQALNAAVSSRIQRLFGVSRIKIDPQFGGAENTAAARLTVEQQVSNEVTVTYITNLAQSQQQVIQLEFNISRNMSVVAVRDHNGVLGFDFRMRRRKR